MTDAKKDCIFCKIANGSLPATKVLEDSSFVAFMDIRPQSPGHILVIPKEHYRWVWDVPNTSDYFEMVKKIAIAQKKAFGVEKIISKIVGDEVPHAHIWLFPDPERTKGDKNDFVGNAEKIKEQLV